MIGRKPVMGQNQLHNAAQVLGNVFHGLERQWMIHPFPQVFTTVVIPDDLQVVGVVGKKIGAGGIVYLVQLFAQLVGDE